MPQKTYCRRIPVKLITAKGKKKKGYRWMVIRHAYGFKPEDITLYETFQDAVNSGYSFGAASDSHAPGRYWYSDTMMDIEASAKHSNTVMQVK